MKKVIQRLEDILALELQCLYAGEKSLKEKIETIIPLTNSRPLIEFLKKYAESSDHKRLKLNRIFSYVMVEPAPQTQPAIEKLLDEMALRVKQSVSDNIKNLVLITGFQQINHYKIADYKIALMYALDLELEIVADLLHQIIMWERKMDKALTELCFTEFKKGTVAQTPQLG